MKQSKVLFNEHPLVVPVETATVFGLNNAIIIQQIHYWTTSKNNKNIKDGYKWVYNSYTEWKNQFPFWSESTIKRSIHKLEKEKLIISANYNKAGFDKTKWYRLNYEEIDKRVTNRSVQNEPMEQVKMNRPIPKTTHRTKKSSVSTKVPTTDFSKDKNNNTHPFKKSEGRQPATNKLKTAKDSLAEGLAERQNINTANYQAVQDLKEYATNLQTACFERNMDVKEVIDELHTWNDKKALYHLNMIYDALDYMRISDTEKKKRMKQNALLAIRTISDDLKPKHHMKKKN